MRILFVAPWVPCAERPRSFGILTHLCREHDVHVVVAAWSDEEERAAESLPGRSVVVVRQSRWGGILRAALAIASRRSLQQAFVGSRRLRKAIADQCNTKDFDVAYFNVIRSAQLLGVIRDSSRVIDLDEFRSGYYRQSAVRARSLVHRVVGAIEAPRLKRAEQRTLSAVDRYIVSSPIDMNPGDSRARLVRSPHQMPSSQIWRGGRKSIVFVGRMSYSANVDAVTWFAGQVWPALSNWDQELTWSIVGSAPGKKVASIADERVRVTGRVPRVEDYYLDCGVAIVPVNLATGVQMKFIEALFLGAPVVASRLVAEQAGVIPGFHCLVADTPTEWFDAIAQVLSDPSEALRLSRNGRTWAMRNYGSGETLKSLNSVLEEIAGGE